MTLTRHYFNEIVSGRKRVEYRQRTAYWEKKLSRPYDEVLFQNGYWPHAPRVRVEFLGVTLMPKETNLYTHCVGSCFGIHLGRILEISNWPPKPQSLAPNSSPSSRALT